MGSTSGARQAVRQELGGQARSERHAGAAAKPAAGTWRLEQTETSAQDLQTQERPEPFKWPFLPASEPNPLSNESISPL